MSDSPQNSPRQLFTTTLALDTPASAGGSEFTARVTVKVTVETLMEDAAAETATAAIEQMKRRIIGPDGQWTEESYISTDPMHHAMHDAWEGAIQVVETAGATARRGMAWPVPGSLG